MDKIATYNKVHGINTQMLIKYISNNVFENHFEYYPSILNTFRNTNIFSYIFFHQILLFVL